MNSHVNDTNLWERLLTAGRRRYNTINKVKLNHRFHQCLDFCKELNKELSGKLKTIMPASNQLNVQMCNAITFASRKFSDVFQFVDECHQSKFITQPLLSRNIPKWIQELSPVVCHNICSMFKKYTLAEYTLNDFYCFGHQHNDGYVFVDLREEGSENIKVISFKKILLKKNDGTAVYWVVYSVIDDFLAIVKDYDFGVFLNQVCIFCLLKLLKLLYFDKL